MPDFTVTADPTADRFTDIKDPDSILPYNMTWTSWLESGDSVSAASWSVSSPSGDATPVVVDSSSLSSDVATAVLSAGTLGNNYVVTCHATSANGYEDDRSIYISMREL